MFARTLGLARLFTPTNASCAKIHQPVARLLRQPLLYLLWQHLIWHLVCVCVCVCQDEFLSHISSCALSQSINWQKCHNKTCAFEQRRSIHAKTTGETVKRSYLLVLHQGLKQLHSKRAANWNRKKWKAWSKKVALQDPASTAAKTHRDCLRHCREVWRSSCSLLSNCHPAKRRVLTTQRARKTQCDFSGEFHPHLQRIGNTEKARLLEVDVYLGGWNGQFLFPFNGLTAETIPQGSGGNTFNEHHSAFTTNSSDKYVVWPHSQYPPKS